MKLLLIGDERRNRRMVARGFAGEPYRVRTASNSRDVGQLIETDRFQAVCIDLQMRQDHGAAILDILHDRVPELPIVALIADPARQSPAGLRARGVSAHLVTPFPMESLLTVLRAHALDAPIGAVRDVVEPLAKATPATPLLARDEIAARTHELARRAANSHAAILLLGETGTGKTLLAQTIHEASPLCHRRFVTVNCPCLNHELLESDLFGHVRGAFTGAVQDTWGKVAAAEGGTLFLDEIGDLPLSVQPKLLRLLQEKQYERVGEVTPRHANVRIVAATNRDLKAEVAAGRFREDLYYRLNVIAIEVPSLRCRPTQIAGAAEAFLESICRQMGRRSPGFTSAAHRLFQGYSWPGNLRELRNVVERAAILSSGAALDVADFPAIAAEPPSSVRFQVGGPISLRALECAHIQLVLANTGSLEEAAQILEIDKSTLYRKRKQMESRMAEFDSPPERTAAAG
jgi:two-component system, NtrC family, response regulator AlgB